MKDKAMKTAPREELMKILATTREQLREASFRVHRGEEKDVRLIRELRKRIAQALTFLKEKK